MPMDEPDKVTTLDVDPIFPPMTVGAAAEGGDWQGNRARPAE